MKRNVYSTVCHRLPKIFPTRKYKIAKLSKLNINWQTTLINLYCHCLCASAKPFWEVLKWLGFRKVFLQNGLFKHTPYYLMKFHKFHGTEQNNMYSSQIMCRIIYPTWQFHVILANLSINISLMIWEKIHWI